MKIAERDSIGGKGEEGDGDAVVDHKGSDRVQNMALESYEGGELFDQITRKSKFQEWKENREE
ncbi:hypothetical protein JHK85_006673 [Glycine max]|nr:hypothetical protein JHK85_006673 [Glycine max]